MTCQYLALNGEAGEYSLRIVQSADGFADWKRPFSHQRWQGKNLVRLREQRIFREINDLDLVTEGGKDSGLC